MTPQADFMVIAPILPGREAELRSLLLTMNRFPGTADPNNPIVPFGQFDTLHFARFVILNDSTLADLEAYGAAFPNAPVYLAFLGDCDGSAEGLLADFAFRAAAGLRQIFAHCEGFDPNGDLLQWMLSHSVKSAAVYVNWIGRTVRQIREEAALHEALTTYLAALSIDDPPQQLRNELRRAVREGGPVLTPPAPTPLAWQVRRLLSFAAAGAAAFVLLLPVLLLSLESALLVYGLIGALVLLALAAFLVQLRRHETTDPVILTPPTDAHLTELGAIQDYDVTNQYSAFGSVKPGLFRRRTTIVVLWLIKLATPILYPRGGLARVKTIHFARWVFFDDKRRVFFASNYDGSAESYMDDFVNKVFFGLNLVFSNGVAYPRTDFLLCGGASREQEFKNFQRRHALPTEVWHKAYPGLTLFDIDRNARIREGLQQDSMTDAEIRQWLSEI
ncbi:hypothetical protein RZS28_03615 [Methylocapsa polymorpha]|uniref:Peroxidase n=1 Tax=Methylocapsa polymorpha TaxID=3080828 RepID=A0ABZ0HUK7_9HYPH|nr:hypothetical protein RZS28_03615 [Methylocapsa sp. RX1]